MFTIREYDYDDGHHTIDIEVPSVNVETLETMDNNIDDSINASIEELTDTLLNEFNREYVGTEGYGSLDITYDVITNNDNWFTLRIIFKLLKVYYYNSPYRKLMTDIRIIHFV